MLKALFDLIIFISAGVSTYGAASVSSAAWSHGSVSRFLIMIVWVSLACVWCILGNLIRVRLDDVE